MNDTNQGKAVEMIQRIPDDDMLYVINILQNLEEMATNKNADNELIEAREKKYSYLI